jgi:hypothetical protein
MAADAMLLLAPNPDMTYAPMPDDASSIPSDALLTILLL